MCLLVWALSALMLLVLLCVRAVHWAHHRDQARAHLLDQAVAPFYGCLSMALLAEVPADLHVLSLGAGENAPRGTLERLRPEPGDLLPKDGAPLTGFRLTLIKGMWASRGNTESGFIRSVDEAVDRFSSPTPATRAWAPRPAAAW